MSHEGQSTAMSQGTTPRTQRSLEIARCEQPHSPPDRSTPRQHLMKIDDDSRYRAVCIETSLITRTWLSFLDHQTSVRKSKFNALDDPQRLVARLLRRRLD